MKKLQISTVNRLDPHADDPPGIDLYRCRARLIWANERVVESRFRETAIDTREPSVCWLVERGRVEVEDSNGIVSAKRGEWLFPGSTGTKQRFSPQSRILSLRFELHWLTGESVFRRRQSRVFKARKHPGLEASARPLVDLIQPWKRAESLMVARNRIPLADNYAIEAAFYAWLAVYIRTMEAAGAALRQPNAYDERVAEAVRRIETHPMETRFEVSNLCQSCGLSPNQLARLFKQQTGRTIRESYALRRMRLARHALVDTSLPVKEIAYNLGFRSPSHFSNWFSEREGRSPRNVRQKYQGGGDI